MFEKQTPNECLLSCLGFFESDHETEATFVGILVIVVLVVVVVVVVLVVVVVEF